MCNRTYRTLSFVGALSFALAFCACTTTQRKADRNQVRKAKSWLASNTQPATCQERHLGGNQKNKLQLRLTVDTDNIVRKCEVLYAKVFSVKNNNCICEQIEGESLASNGGQNLVYVLPIKSVLFGLAPFDNRNSIAST